MIHLLVSVEAYWVEDRDRYSGFHIYYILLAWYAFYSWTHSNFFDSCFWTTENCYCPRSPKECSHPYTWWGDIFCLILCFSMYSLHASYRQGCLKLCDLYTRVLLFIVKKRYNNKEQNQYLIMGNISLSNHTPLFNVSISHL